MIVNHLLIRLSISFIDPCYCFVKIYPAQFSQNAIVCFLQNVL